MLQLICLWNSYRVLFISLQYKLTSFSPSLCISYFFKDMRFYCICRQNLNSYMHNPFQKSRAKNKSWEGNKLQITSITNSSFSSGLQDSKWRTLHWNPCSHAHKGSPSFSHGIGEPSHTWGLPLPLWQCGQHAQLFLGTSRATLHLKPPHGQPSS